MLLNKRHATAYGANFIIMSIIFDVMAKRDSITLTNGAETGAGSSVMAMPMISAKNMMCSMFGLLPFAGSPAIEAKTFVGTTVFTTDISAVSALASASAFFCAS